MKLLILLSLIFSLQTAVAKCNYIIKKDDFKVNWTAFKTPLKVGVKGSFDKLGVKKDATGNDLGSLLSEIPFKIDGASVNTQNKDRDLKIAINFFAPMGNTIQGKLVGYEKKLIKLQLTMNNITKMVPLKATITDDMITADGTIDILDFNMGISLTSINNACKELHEGKTWNDVEIQLNAKYSKDC